MKQTFISVALIFIVSLALRLDAATLTYSYDSLNRLTNAAYSDGSRESYSHDDAGNRLSRVTLAWTIKFDTIAPTVPGAIQFSVLPSGILLSWNRSFDTGGAGLAGYATLVNGNVVGDGTTTNILITNLPISASYCFSVAAYDRLTNVSAESLSFCTNETFHPTFTMQPTNQTVLAGNNVSFVSAVLGNPSIQFPLDELGRSSEVGLEYLTPEIVLLYKSKYAEQKDHQDFEKVLPHLSDKQKIWLKESLIKTQPGHLWIRSL